jgi:transmembrane sensor
MRDPMTGQDPSGADEEAVAWFVLLRDEAATAEDRARFDAWLQADPRHCAAWQEVEALWRGMDCLQPRPETLPGPGSRASARRHRPATRWRQLAAAAVLLLAVAAGTWLALPQGYAVALLADHRTATAELKTLKLPDGSTVALGPTSALSVAFDGAARRVVLHRGQGYFSVTPDPDRPFIVEAAGGRITVVGTSFDVKIGGGEAIVAVASGLVDVAAGAGAPVRLSPGQSVRYTNSEIGPTLAVDRADVGSWRDRRLVFLGAPLGEVLRDLERYRRGQILVLDDAIAALPVSGVFDTSRPDAALNAIARTLPVKLTIVADLVVVIRPRD